MNFLYNIDSFYEEYKNPKIVKNGWIIVDTEGYNQLQKDIKINHIRISYNVIPVKDSYGNTISNIQEVAVMETKDNYIKLRYNSSFLAMNIYEREYDRDKGISILDIKRSPTFDLKENPPQLKFILKILGLKVSKKVYNNIDIFD